MKSSRGKSHTPRPWERIYVAFFIGVFVTSLIAVPISMYGLEALKSNMRLIGAVIITLIWCVAVAFGVIFLFRRRIAKKMGFPAPGLLRDVYDPAISGLQALRAGQFELAYEHLSHAGGAAVSYYSWVTIRWWMVSTSIGLVGVFCTVAGTALLFRHNDLIVDHNQLIVDQNRKINEQNLRLRLQNQLLFSQADVQVSHELSRMQQSIHLTTKTVRWLRRGRSDVAKVRWCTSDAASCSAWQTIRRDADVCAVVETPADAPCGDIRLRDIYDHLMRAGTWSRDFEFARRALDVLHNLELSVPLHLAGADEKLADCEIDDQKLDTFEVNLEEKHAIAFLLSTRLHDRANIRSETDLDERLLEMSIVELATHLQDIHRRLLDQTEPLALQCEKKVQATRLRYKEKRAQHAALGQEVKN